jgi:alpha-tubulin suppressor-like RCC1 family protein
LFVPITPDPFVGSLLVDTRRPGAQASPATADGKILEVGPVAAGTPLRVPVTGRGGFPAAGVEAVALQLTAIDATVDTHLTVYPTGVDPPPTSSLALAAGQTVQNLVIVEPGADGSVSIANSEGATHLVVHAVGWFPERGGFVPVAWARLTDTRPEGSSVDGRSQAIGPITSGSALQVPVTGRAGLPQTGIGTVVLTVTATNATEPTTLTVYPGGTPHPTVSTLTITPGRTVTNTVITQPGSDGTVTIDASAGSTDVIVDLFGWFPPTTGYTPVTPARLLDTLPDGATIDGLTQRSGAIAARGRLDVPVAGRAGVPVTRIGAVALTLTIVSPTTDGVLAVDPTGREGQQPASIVAPGPTTTRTIISEVGGGSITILNYSKGANHVIVDLVGWFPEQPPLADVTGIATGLHHTCALISDGTVRCWGPNEAGELGNGTDSKSEVPVLVADLTDAVAITAGAGFSCALLGDGTAQCWGKNDYGQLGDGTTTNSDTPVTVVGLTDAVALTTALEHTCARLGDGSVQCWGRNQFGQLGDDTTTDSAAPVTVIGVGAATAISAGGHHTCVLLIDETVTCWGRNEHGELGNGTTTNSAVPVTVIGVGGVGAISAGGRHTCALLTDRTAQCWGSDASGELGNGEVTRSRPPVTVTGLTGAIAITAGFQLTCALLADGTARCWGRNEWGQVGNGSHTPTGGGDEPNAVTLPDTVIGLTGAVAIAPSALHTCALMADGTARCWGNNSFGQVGRYASLIPVTVVADRNPGVA